MVTIYKFANCYNTVSFLPFLAVYPLASLSVNKPGHRGNLIKIFYSWRQEYGQCLHQVWWTGLTRLGQFLEFSINSKYGLLVNQVGFS